MGYVSSNLMTDEKVVYMAPIHWAIYLPGLTILIMGIASGILMQSINPVGSIGSIIGAILSIVGISSLIKAWIFKFSTELAVTSKRVISKSGLIRRSSHELNHSKIESLHIDQSILGRILGFGTIVVKGTGGGSAPIANIDNPMLFRTKAMEAIG